MTRFLLLFLIFFTLSIRSFAVYDVNDNCKKAWMLMMDLKLDRARDLLADEIKHNPANYYAYYLDQTCDVFRLLINSSDQDYRNFLENYSNKRNIMNGKDVASPYYLSCAAEMEIQVSVLSVMHGSNYNSIKKGYAAYQDVYRNLKKYPQFGPNRKLDGFFNVAIANLPPFVKWATSVFGVKSDIKYGFKTLFENYQVQKNTAGINAEAALYLILAAKINKTPEMLYDFSGSLDPGIAGTFIQQYFKANIEYWCGKNDEALKTLQQASADKSEYADVLYNYLMGKILLRKLDPNAEYYFLKYLAHLKKKEYLKEMNYDLALCCLIKGDRSKFSRYCDIVRHEGMNLNERDREALYEVNLDYSPDVNLVKARLSLDGGYYDAYNKAMASFETGHAKVPAYDIEYHFLKARYAAIRKNFGLATAEFRNVIEAGEDKHYYFACEAALRLGEIYQKTGQVTMAKNYYKKSLSLYRKDYYEYIEDKATKAMNSL